jgi:hypothetical protein
MDVVRTPHRLAGVLGAVALLAAAPSAAAAPGPPPPDVAAIAQYFESFPTSGGDRLSGTASGKTPLPPAVAREVRRSGGADADALLELATSASHGAPQQAPGEPRSPGSPRTDPSGSGASAPGENGSATAPVPQEEPSFAEAVVDVGGASGGGGMTLLFVVLLASTVALGTAAVLGRARRRN